MRVIIACAGLGSRWNEYLGVPKHLARTADGQVLLHRTVEQALRYTDEDVHITAPPADDRYTPHVGRVVTHSLADPSWCEFAASRPWWSTEGRTVLLLGDAYFTDEAIAAIMAGSPTAYRVFGRYRASKVTGTPYGEIFATSWGPGRITEMDARLAEVLRLREAGECTRPPGWVLLRLWQGTPVGQHVVKRPIWTEIDDWTDDLDSPEDYRRHPAFGGAHARG